MHIDVPKLSLRSPYKLSITFIFYFLSIMFKLRCWCDQKPGIVFNCSFSFAKDWIWARPNWCAQIRYTDVENSLYQPLSELFSAIEILEAFFLKFLDHVFHIIHLIGASWNYILSTTLQRYSKTLIYISTCFYYVRH